MSDGGVTMQIISRAEVAQRVASAVAALATAGADREGALLSLASCLTVNEVFGVQKLVDHDRGQCVRCGVWVPMNRVDAGKCMGCANSTRGMSAEDARQRWSISRAVKS